MADKVDILMKIVDEHGPVIGESQSVLTRGDDFVKGFEPGMFFDISDFDFDVSVRGDDGGGESDDDDEKPRTGSDGKPVVVPKKKKKKSGGFSQWLAGPHDGYPVDMQPFQFTKELDQTSPLLFYFCSNSISLKSVTMVHRKAGGQKAVGQGYWGYLRIDFTDVLLTSVSWDVADAIATEKVKFICREIKVQYRSQNPDGSMAEPIGVEWKFKAGLVK